MEVFFICKNGSPQNFGSPVLLFYEATSTTKLSKIGINARLNEFTSGKNIYLM